MFPAASPIDDTTKLSDSKDPDSKFSHAANTEVTFKIYPPEPAVRNPPSLLRNVNISGLVNKVLWWRGGDTVTKGVSVKQRICVWAIDLILQLPARLPHFLDN